MTTKSSLLRPPLSSKSIFASRGLDKAGHKAKKTPPGQKRGGADSDGCGGKICSRPYHQSLDLSCHTRIALPM